MLLGKFRRSGHHSGKRQMVDKSLVCLGTLQAWKLVYMRSVCCRGAKLLAWDHAARAHHRDLGKGVSFVKPGFLELLFSTTVQMTQLSGADLHICMAGNACPWGCTCLPPALHLPHTCLTPASHLPSPSPVLSVFCISIKALRSQSFLKLLELLLLNVVGIFVRKRQGGSPAALIEPSPGAWS